MDSTSLRSFVRGQTVTIAMEISRMQKNPFAFALCNRENAPHARPETL